MSTVRGLAIVLVGIECALALYRSEANHPGPQA
jgi:hypothetical protein